MKSKSYCSQNHKHLYIIFIKEKFYLPLYVASGWYNCQLCFMYSIYLPIIVNIEKIDKIYVYCQL